MSAVNKAELLASLPPAWPDDLLPAIQRRVAETGRKLVVLDDDPTGTQTVHGIPVLTEWPVTRLRAELDDPGTCFYILTNSRSLPLAEAQTLNAEIGRNLTTAAQTTGRALAVVSRSDSTLRGHFPGEVDALVDALGDPVDGWLIVPYFLEGGRYTINDVHYVAEGDSLIPAGETPYAQDASFGYTASNLRNWVAEKTGGRVPAAAVARISLDDLRQRGPDRVTEKLLALDRGAVCVVNAASYRDLEVFVLGLLEAEARGRRYLYRTAASFVRVRAGIAPHPLLTVDDLGLSGAANGGLFVIGSYVPKSTRQFHVLRQSADMHVIEINVPELLNDEQRDAAIARTAQDATAALAAGQDTVIATSRQLVTGKSAEESLTIGRIVSTSLVAVLRAIETQPRYLVAKGGITSSDVATQGLDVKRADILGQILPGVPVWKLGPESRYPGAPYIVFPGNVGDDDALAVIRNALQTGQGA